MFFSVNFTHFNHPSYSPRRYGGLHEHTDAQVGVMHLCCIHCHWATLRKTVLPFYCRDQPYAFSSLSPQTETQ